MQALAAHQGGHALGVGTLDDATLGHDGIDKVRRGHVEYRIVGIDLGRHPSPADFQQFATVALFDRDVLAALGFMSMVELGATTMKRTPWCMALTANW